jgi:hypothetical protein
VGTPFRAGDWRLGGDGFVFAAAEPPDGLSPSALLHLGTGESFRLLVYQQEVRPGVLTLLRKGAVA